MSAEDYFSFGDPDDYGYCGPTNDEELVEALGKMTWPSEWERSFVISITSWIKSGKKLTARQSEVAEQMYRRYSR